MSDNNRSFAQALLEEHNKLREKYGNVAPLLLDTDLSSLAQKHSDSLAKKQSKLELSENENVGENLYFSNQEIQKQLMTLSTLSISGCVGLILMKIIDQRKQVISHRSSGKVRIN